MKKQQILVGMVVTPTPNSTGFGYVVNIEHASSIALFIQKKLKPFLPDVKIEVESLPTCIQSVALDEYDILRDLCQGWAKIIYKVYLTNDIIATVETLEEARILASKSWTDDKYIHTMITIK